MRHDATASGDLGEESFDVEHAKETLYFFLRGPRRHPKVAAAIFVVLTAVGVAGAITATLTYEAEALVLVQKNVAMPALGDGNRNGQADFDPTTGVYETVKGRENLLALARETHLVDKTDFSRVPYGRPLTDEEKLQFAAKTLEWRLNVKTEGPVVTFIGRWNDPQTAYDLATGAARNFFNTRNAAEVSIISDAITLFEEHAKAEREGIDSALQEFLRLKEGWTGASPVSAPSVPLHGSSSPARARTAQSGVGPDADLAQKLADQRRRIRETEDEWRRQLSEAKNHLAGLLATLTPSHPSVAAAQRRVDSLGDEPAQLAALKNEEREMLNDLAGTTGAKADAARPAGGGGRVPGLAGAMPVVSSRESGQPRTAQDLELIDPPSALALSRLQNRVRKYEDFMDQISAAKLQLDLARNTFKYRYAMFRPAEVPRKPRWPVRFIWVGAGLGLGILLSIFVPATIDLVRGRFIEPWQVKRRLGLPVLGEVSPPRS
jgi:uncharacterized protein involved in exopolysaccharide biosynthesis